MKKKLKWTIPSLNPMSGMSDVARGQCLDGSADASCEQGPSAADCCEGAGGGGGGPEQSTEP